MVDIAQLVAALGGMAQKQQLVARGAGDLDLTRAVRSGAVSRARQGWYTTLPEPSEAVRAVRVGGRLTGLSAIAAEGGWVQKRPPLHVSVPPNAARLRSASNRFVHPGARHLQGVVLHWDGAGPSQRGSATSVALVDALVRVALDEDLETAVAAFDWALHFGRIDLLEFEWLLLQLPLARRTIKDWVDPECESLPESLARTRMRLRGHRVVSQVRLGDVERIDVVVDECLALEVDGDAHHRERFEEDRRKDLDITIARLHVLRPSARAVFGDWPRVQLAIDAALQARGVPVPSGNSGVRWPCRAGRPVTTGRRCAGYALSPEFPERAAGEWAGAGAWGLSAGAWGIRRRRPSLAQE